MQKNFVAPGMSNRLVRLLMETIYVVMMIIWFLMSFGSIAEAVSKVTSVVPSVSVVPTPAPTRLSLAVLS